MTVRELISRLMHEDPDAEVYFEHPSHDYWRTQLASEVCAFGVKTVGYSDYHQQYALPRDEERVIPEKERPKKVLLLRSHK